ncbi:MAG: hypothetical protein JOZ58_04245 [Acetobacteraceae bacterium]|jgi:hypothetical protein|nr:hypothetical protein [Acetobacteraceae bacterium]MBV8574237.1 hypothetical protein [Acetobacteraceae bacterium]
MPSDQTGTAAGTSSPQGGSSGLLDSQGRALNRARGQFQPTGGELEEFIRTQPISAVLIALGIGYILGRLGI